MPVALRVEAPDRVAATRAAEVLAKSPRLAIDGAGFPLVISVKGEALRACLQTIAGSEIACGELEDAREVGEDTAARELAVSFHKEVFALRVGLHAADLQSLDGSPGIASKAQREMLNESLREITGETLQR